VPQGWTASDIALLPIETGQWKHYQSWSVEGLRIKCSLSAKSGAGRQVSFEGAVAQPSVRLDPFALFIASRLTTATPRSLTNNLALLRRGLPPPSPYTPPPSEVTPRITVPRTCTPPLSRSRRSCLVRSAVLARLWTHTPLGGYPALSGAGQMVLKHPLLTAT
jgi:hypothetical protein